MTEVEDIGETPECVALQRAIDAVPEDEAPQLVLADLLQAAGDPRGELIVLDMRERVGDLVDTDGLTRLLFLAAEYSFPRARPDDPALPFTGYGSRPPRFSTLFERTHYHVRYTGGLFELFVDVQPQAILATRLDCESILEWTAEETALILRLLGDAIRAKTPLDQLVLPFSRHALPRYEGGPQRGYRLARRFLERFELPPERYGLAPRDYHRWMRIWQRIAQ